MTEREYHDDYSGCASTYVALIARHWSEPASRVTEALELTPTREQEARPRIERPGDVPMAAKMHVWQLSSESFVQSRDFRRHLAWLLAHLDDRHPALDHLRERGWQTDVSVYWLSRHGHGGPSLWPEQSAALGKLGLEIWFDVYFDESPEASNPMAPGELTQNFQRLTRHWRRFGMPKRT